MAIHVAILHLPYLQRLLDGRKTIESRLMKNAVVPFGQVTTGERIFFKASAGPFMATAVAHQVEQFDNLTPAKIDALQTRYNSAIWGDDAYWHRKRSCRFGVLIHLREVEPLSIGPRYTSNPWRAWHVLDEQASPLLDATLTAGAIRNRYVTLPRVSDELRRSGLTLELPDGQKVPTQISRGKMLRWRGWGKWFLAYDVKPGDKVRFVALGRRRYAVTFRQADAIRP